MKNQIRVIASGLIAALLSFPALGQSAGGTEQQKEKEPAEETDPLVRRAVDTLRDIGYLAFDIRDPVARGDLFGAVVATLLKRDRAAARELLITISSSNSDSAIVSGRIFAAVNQIDPTLGAELLSNIASQRQQPALSGAVSDSPLGETEIASALVSSNPKESAAWLIRGLRRGFDREQLDVWQLLFRIEPTQGVAVFDAIAELAKRAGPQGAFAGLLLMNGSFEIADANSFRNQLGSARAAVLLGVMRRLFANEVPDYGGAPPFPIPSMRYAIASGALALSRRYAPEQAKEFEDMVRGLAELDEEDKTGFDELLGQQTLGPDVDSEDSDEIAALAEKAASPARRDSLYARAAEIALGDKEIEDALSLAMKIGNSPLRDSLVKRTIAMAIRMEPGMAETEDAYRVISKIAEPQVRIEALVQIAGAAAARGDGMRALELIRESEQLLESVAALDDRSASSLHIVSVTAGIDTVRAFESMADAVKILNAWDSARGANAPALCQRFPDFIPSFSRLGKADFEHAFLVAGDLQRDQCRLFARWAAADGLLSSLPKSAAAPVKK